MDLTQDTTNSARTLSPYTGHGADGEAFTGGYVEKTLTTKSITANGTYSASSDNADGYSSVTVNVPSSGGSSAWTKIAETSYTIENFTGTTAQTHDTWSTGHSELWTNSKWVYVRVRDTAGKRAGYFYGSDNFFMVYTTTAASTTVGTRFYTRCNSSGIYAATSTASTAAGNGVYVDTLYSDGRIRVRKRYNSSSSLTIDGTYKVEVYLLDPAGGIPIFE